MVLRYLRFLERSRFLHCQPFGHFIAMRIDMCYTMRTLQNPILHELPSSVSRPGYPASCRLSASPPEAHSGERHPHGVA
jgi:hypothetical protein